MTSAALRLAEVPAAVLAGGRATRLGPVAEKTPKALLEVAGRPFIDHQLALLHRRGLRHIVLCVGHRGEQIQAHVGDGKAFGLAVGYSFDGERLLGTGGALKRAEPLLGEAFFVTYGDSYMDIDYGAVLATFTARSRLGLMTVIENRDRWDRSNVVYRGGRLLRYDKRVPTPEMTHVDYGVTLLRREALAGIPAGEPYDLADLYSALVGEGRMEGFEVRQRFYHIGTPQALAETEAYLSGR